MRDVIFISLENWDGVWRRNQFLCAEWLRRFPNMRLLFVGRSQDFSHAARTLNLEGVRGAAFRKSEDFNGLFFLNPIKLLPNSIALGRLLNQRSLFNQIRRAARQAGLRKPLLWINDHFAGFLAGELDERAVVYDITDDWSLMPAIPPAERARIQKADRALCGRADLVVVCSEALELSRREHAAHLLRIPNGVDAAHYASCFRQARGAQTGQGRTEGQAVFGYLGTLHQERLDIDLVLALATARPADLVVLCGPDFLDANQRRRLGEHRNIELRGPVDYRQVPEVLAVFDVCILPHKITPFTESLNPIKLWEYLATGKPIAATPVAGFRERAHLCELGAGAEGFLAACERALRESDPSQSARRVHEAEQHSWRSRAELLLSHFRHRGWLGRQPEAARSTRKRSNRECRTGLAPGRCVEAAVPGDRGLSQTNTAASQSMRLSVVVVSFNTRELTLRCLESLCRHSPAGTDICVLDNASSDGSPDAIEAFASGAPNPVRLIRAQKNVGFGPANNCAVAEVSGDFIALVNSDAFVEPGALAVLVSHLAGHRSVAIAGPVLLNADGSIQESQFAFPTPARAWLENLGLSGLARLVPKAESKAQNADWLGGACLVVRREAWIQSGGFDESFFLYAEETDWQRRLRDLGWEIHFVSEARVTHVGGASGMDCRAQVRERFFEGADRYVRKHHGLAGALSFRAATAVGAALRWLRDGLHRALGGGGARRSENWAWLLERQLFRPLPEPLPETLARVGETGGADTGN